MAKHWLSIGLDHRCYPNTHRRESAHQGRAHGTLEGFVHGDRNATGERDASAGQPAASTGHRWDGSTIAVRARRPVHDRHPAGAQAPGLRLQ